jgi:hypothetical protein
VGGEKESKHFLFLTQEMEAKTVSFCFYIPTYVYNSYPNLREVISYCGFDLCFPDNQKH